jgi:hypothetical protein
MIFSQSQSQIYFMTGDLPPISSSWREAPWDSRSVILFSNWTLRGYSPYVKSSLTRGLVCRLQLLLARASTVILRSKFRGTHDHILLSQIPDSSNLEGQVPVFISPRNRVTRYTPGTGFSSSPPATSRATVEVFDTASTRGYCTVFKWYHFHFIFAQNAHLCRLLVFCAFVSD